MGTRAEVSAVSSYPRLVEYVSHFAMSLPEISSPKSIVKSWSI